MRRQAFYLNMPIIFDASKAKLSIIYLLPQTEMTQTTILSFSIPAHGHPAPHRTQRRCIPQEYIRHLDAATGFSFIASNSKGFANYTMWSPVYVQMPAWHISIMPGWRITDYFGMECGRGSPMVRTSTLIKMQVGGIG